MERNMRIAVVFNRGPNSSVGRCAAEHLTILTEQFGDDAEYVYIDLAKTDVGMNHVATRSGLRFVKRIGVMERYTEEAKKASKAGIDHSNKGRLVKLPTEGEWVEITSPQGAEVLKKAKEPCVKARKRLQKCKSPNN